MEKKIDCDFTDNAVCPHCGWENLDSWEYTAEDGLTDCGECDKEFYYTTHAQIHYSTSIPEPKETKTNA